MGLDAGSRSGGVWSNHRCCSHLEPHTGTLHCGRSRNRDWSRNRQGEADPMHTICVLDLVPKVNSPRPKRAQAQLGQGLNGPGHKRDTPQGPEPCSNVEQFGSQATSRLKGPQAGRKSRGKGRNFASTLTSNTEQTLVGLHPLPLGDRIGNKCTNSFAKCGNSKLLKCHPGSGCI